MFWNPAPWWGFQNIDCGLGSGRFWRLDRVSGTLTLDLVRYRYLPDTTIQVPDLHPPGEPTPNKITSELTPNRNAR